MTDVLEARFAALADRNDDSDWLDVRRRARRRGRRWVLPGAAAAAAIVAAASLAAGSGWLFSSHDRQVTAVTHVSLHGHTWRVALTTRAGNWLSRLCVELSRPGAPAINGGCGPAFSRLVGPPFGARHFDVDGGQIWTGAIAGFARRISITDTQGRVHERARDRCADRHEDAVPLLGDRTRRSGTLDRGLRRAGPRRPQTALVRVAPEPRFEIPCLLRRRRRVRDRLHVGGACVVVEREDDCRRDRCGQPDRGEPRQGVGHLSVSDTSAHNRRLRLECGCHLRGRRPVIRVLAEAPGDERPVGVVEQLLQDDTERVDIRRRADRAPLRLLRCEVAKGAEHGARLREHRLLGRPCDAEVRDLHLARGAAQEVCRLEVAMHDAVAVRVRERVRDVRCFAAAQPRAFERPGEKQLHDDARSTVVLGDVVRADEVRVVEPRGDPRLAEEARAELRVVGEMLREHLQCDRTVEAFVVARIHDRHPAATDLPVDAICAHLSCFGSWWSWP